MATPTTEEIKERAIQKFMAENAGRGAYEEGGQAPSEPEEDELKETGVWEEARRELMSEGGNLSPEEKERAQRRKAELLEELKSVREALGYKPRPKKEKVEELVEAAKSGSDQDASKALAMATREELEALPGVGPEEAVGALPGPRESRQHFPGRKLERSVIEAQKRAHGRSVTEPTPAQKAEAALAAKAKALGQRALSKAETIRQAHEEEKARRLAEREELKQFAKEVKLAEKKRVILARATARVEKESELAEGGYTGEGPVRELGAAIRRKVIRGIERTGAADMAERRFPDQEPVEQHSQAEQDLSTLRPPGYGGWSHHWSLHWGPKHFEVTHPKPPLHWDLAHPRQPMHWAQGEPKEHATSREHVRQPHWHVSWKRRGPTKRQLDNERMEEERQAKRSSVEEMFPGLVEKASSPSYLKGHRPYPFQLVKPGDKDVREQLEREKEESRAQKRIEE
jgi:hypothetical protein